MYWSKLQTFKRIYLLFLIKTGLLTKTVITVWCFGTTLNSLRDFKVVICSLSVKFSIRVWFWFLTLFRAACPHNPDRHTVEVSDFPINSSFFLYFNWAICSAPSPHPKGESYDLWCTLDPGRSKALGRRSENICQVRELYLNETKRHHNNETAGANSS